MQPVDRRALRADSFLLLAAVIWGSGFVAQREISLHLAPFSFNAVRNLIALVALLPFVLFVGRSREPQAGPRRVAPGWGLGLAAGLATGSVVFLGGWLQQAGIERTTAGNAGFITGLYVVLVPILARLAGARIHASTWLAALFAMVGMYLLGSSGPVRLGPGDGLVLVSAVFWALHVHAVGYFASRVDSLWLACLQVAFAALFSLPFALLTEPVSWTAIRASGWPMLYSGTVCGAFAFTLQMAGQRRAPPAHAALLMSLESVFAALFGALLLGERLGVRGLFGAALMLVGMMASQWPQLRTGKPA